jgi:hypothetical protein
MTSLATYTHRLGRAYRRNRFAWRYVRNAAPSLAYAMQRRALVAESARVLAEMNRDGVATTTLEALGVGGELFEALSESVAELERRKADELDAARRAAQDASRIGSKTFNVELLGGEPVLDPGDVFCRFAIARPILDIANAYFEMFTRLRYFNVWHTLATRSAPRESQLWHRDREDLLIMKIFVYISDVSQDAGPFTYAPGTHAKGAIRQEPAYALEGHIRRTTDDQMAAVVPPSLWKTAVGSRGTLVFADTRGFHKGGLARGTDRLMYTCMFTSRASESRELLDRTRPLPSGLERDVAFALT